MATIAGRPRLVEAPPNDRAAASPVGQSGDGALELEGLVSHRRSDSGPAGPAKDLQVQFAQTDQDGWYESVFVGQTVSINAVSWEPLAAQRALICDALYNRA